MWRRLEEMYYEYILKLFTLSCHVSWIKICQIWYIPISDHFGLTMYIHNHFGSDHIDIWDGDDWPFHQTHLFHEDTVIIVRHQKTYIAFIPCPTLIEETYVASTPEKRVEYSLKIHGRDVLWAHFDTRRSLCLVGGHELAYISFDTSLDLTILA